MPEIEFSVRLDDGGQLADLSEWLSGHRGVDVEVMAGEPPAANAQGSMWDFLSVTCAAGGPAVAALRALQLWIESRVTVVNLTIDGRQITVRTQDAATVLPEIAQAVRVLESGGDGTGRHA